MPAAVGGRRAIIIIIIVNASTMPQSLAVDPAGESVLVNVPNVEPLLECYSGQ